MMISISSFASKNYGCVKQLDMFTIVRNFSLLNIKPIQHVRVLFFYKAPPTTVYSVCTFKYFYNITVQPSILDGGNHILLANQKAAKNLICSHNHNLAMPLAQFPYVLVNRSLLCHCRLQSGMTHLAKSLASCKDATSLKLYFTINAAFNHFMAVSALPHSSKDPNQLLPEQYIFEISSTCQLLT